MKSYFRNYAKEGELSYRVAERFAKESTKEDLAKKIIEIIEGNNTDWETINMIAYLCKNVKGGKRMPDERKAMFEDWKNKNKDKIEGVVITLLSYEKGVDTKTCYDEVDWIIQKAFLAGLKACRPKWHDLRKNPKDLPLKGEKDYITNIGVMTFTSLHDRLIWTTPLCEACDYHVEVTDEVIAWCEIPVFEGV